jgi:hypothetical protein
MPTSSPIGLYFYDFPNFGDMLNVEISKLLGIDIQHAEKEDADAMFIGSLLSGFTNGDEYLSSRAIKVWGTGFIRPPSTFPEKLRRPLDVYAVRGRATLERLRNITGEKFENVALGDPGLLASRLIDAAKMEKKYKIGIIPHYLDKGSPLIEKIHINNAIVVDIQGNTLDFLSRIAECENVISSSLHGLITADSLKIPNVRMIINELKGGDYKFDDYYSAFGIENHLRIDLHAIDEFSDIEFIKENYTITPESIEKICDDLTSAFPYKNGVLNT